VQSPAEKHLIAQLTLLIKTTNQLGRVPTILNVGAGRSVVIENALAQNGCEFVGDRADVEDCAVVGPMIRRCYECSVEEMTPIPSREYAAVFANYVIEHIEDPQKAALEIFRVLEPGGMFIASIPNPAAPEFRLAKRTPLSFHKRVRKADAWDTRYAYNRIPELVDVFNSVGFKSEDVSSWSWVDGYLHRYPLLKYLGRLYDAAVSASGIESLRGHVCARFRRPPA